MANPAGASCGVWRWRRILLAFLVVVLGFLAARRLLETAVARPPAPRDDRALSPACAQPQARPLAAAATLQRALGGAALGTRRIARRPERRSARRRRRTVPLRRMPELLFGRRACARWRWTTARAASTAAASTGSPSRWSTDGPGLAGDGAVMDRYARHRAIEGFSQEELQASRVAVIGAGAIGNEVVKNLCLLGVGAIDVYDFDTVELHNLTRSVLLREADVGRSKAASVARRAAELDPAVESIGDRRRPVADTVLRRARALSLRDRRARQLRGAPAAEPAVLDRRRGLDQCRDRQPLRHRRSLPVRRSRGDAEVACYECGLPASVYQRIAERYSCGGLQRAAAAQRIMPTTAITASLAGAQAVNRALAPAADRRSAGSSIRTAVWRRRRHLSRADGCPCCNEHPHAAAIDPPCPRRRHRAGDRCGGARSRRRFDPPQRRADLVLRMRQLRQHRRDTRGGTAARGRLVGCDHLLPSVPQPRDPRADPR